MVKYTGKIPDRNYSIDDFRDKRIILLWYAKFNSSGIPSVRAVFKSNGLLGEIRTTCYGNTYAVDVEWGWWTNMRRCLTTECKTIREAKSILFLWFKENGYYKTTKEVLNSCPYSSSLLLNNYQLKLF